MLITVTINNKEYTKEIEERVLLVDFIRDHCHLTGTHIGCDTSQCGACVVQVNGKSVKSCAVLAVSVHGATIKTIEGMTNPDGSLSPIQQAFQDFHGLQCGFCTPGMIMTADALLQEQTPLTEQEIRHCLDGNICRCTGYHNIVKAIKHVADSQIAPK